MHARMTVAHARPDRYDDAVATVQEAFLPAAQDQPRYAGFLLLTDPETHQLIGISLWASAADLEASGAPGGYYAERMASFGALVTEPPATTIHQVAVREP